jgi:RNA polymerase sigma-70 factor (ECF subfamily)
MDSTMTVARAGSRGVSLEDSFRDLFGRHYGAVFGYAARRLGWHEAGDATAEVFTVAWRRMRSVPDEPNALPWLYGVARRVVANHQRSARRRERLEARSLSEPERRFEPDPTDLDQALGALRESDREVLMLVAWEGLSPSALAKALGCSKNAAVVRLHRARARLNAAWDERGER